VLPRLALLLSLVLTGCHHDADPPPMHPKPGELPPLPPSSGTPVGFLLDAAGDLHLRDDQVSKLKEIDASLAAQQADIDTQLRAIEQPDKDQEKEDEEEHRRHNNAPGQGIKTNADAGRLHEVRDRNDQEALGKAFVVLAPDQQVAARKILEDHGMHPPGNGKPQPKPQSDAAGVPMEP
jgi:hypothetical protein